MRMDINRILQRWDPLCIKGLPGADREYEQYIGPLLIMVKKQSDMMEIARHLDQLMTETWRLPRNKQQCVDVARKIYNVGSIFRGETTTE